MENGQAARSFQPAPGLPKSYDQNWLMALPRDPNCIWLYWELKNRSGDAEIRLYFAKDQRLARTAPCRIENVNHYLEVSESGNSYYAEMGTAAANGRQWRPFLRSNIVTLPYGYPADEIASRRIRYFTTVTSGISSWVSSRISSRITALSSRVSSRFFSSRISSRISSRVSSRRSS